jgi:hypothetical protein
MEQSPSKEANNSSASQEIPHREPTGLLVGPTPGPYPEPYESIPHPLILFSQDSFLILSHCLCLGLPKSRKVAFIFWMCATSTVLLLRNVVTQILFNKCSHGKV